MNYSAQQMKKIIQNLLMVVLAGLVVLPVAAEIKPLKEAPDFTLKSNQGTNIRLSELRGEVVLINFWASWCGPCRDEMPLLNDIYLKFRDKGFKLLGVNVEEDFRKGKIMVRDLKIVFPILLDSENTVSKKFDIDAMPTTVLVDRDGNIRYIHMGYLPGYEDEYLKQVRELLQE